MKARTKFLISGLLVVVMAGYLMATAIRQTGSYFVTPTELATRVTADTTLYDTPIKMGARVVPGSIERDPGGRSYRFSVTDGAHTYPVVYRGLAPDTFTDSVDVVVDGRLGRDGTFHATTLLAKCASRYESAPGRAPENVRRTPGYRQAAERRA